MWISLCMIVRNEEENIINCLERALKVVDEAIIVDTGSTDKTIELLKEKYGNDGRVKVLEEEWEDDFSKARNKSLEYATGDWILILDADERIFCNRGQLEKFLRNSNYPAYNIPIYNVYDKNNLVVSAAMVRLYKNNNPRYKGAIHEQLEIDGQSYAGEVIDKDICKIYHYGYNSNVFLKKDKSRRNMDIIKEEIQRNPEDPFNWYNKGVMEMIAANYEVALDDFIKSHELCNSVRRSFHNDLLIRMIQCIMLLKDYGQAAIFIESISEDVVMKDMPDIYYYLGVCYTKLEKYDEAIKSFQKAVDIGEYSNGISKFGVGSFLSMIEWAKVLELKGEKLLAIEKYMEAVFNENNIGKQGLDELKRLLKEEDMVDELNQLEKILSENNKAGSNANSIEESIINNEEFEKYKKEVKESIQALVENGMLAEAKEGIVEYEKIVKNDIDIYSIRAVIAMMEEDFDEAEKVLMDGLAIDEASFDLLYNMAYLHDFRQKNELAVEYYKKAYFVAKDENIKNKIEEEVKRLNGSLVMKVLIGSPIHQEPEILKEFLKSLNNLRRDKIDVHYMFVDDNIVQESSNILKEFAEEQKNVSIYKSDYCDQYIRNDKTHLWSEELVWKVADFKDRIIEYAVKNNFDSLFLVDSDLILHPNTLQQLISTGKNIVSEIFWTKWQPNGSELPQVWLKDFYTLYESKRGEFLTQEEIAKREGLFINKLRIPGVYEVGGLGACTLISKAALQKGVSFKEIKNISFRGEDRHFCVRAAALGLSLFVDTHYPAYHIYRKKDLKGVADFVKKCNSKKITLVNTSYSGSNNIAMWKLVPEYIKDKYYIEIIQQSHNSEYFNKIMSSDVVIMTEGNYHFNKDVFNKEQLVIDLWHGFPFKAMGYVDKGEVFKDHISAIWRNVDYIGSYSELFNINMNKCINTDISKYKILGAPRNDFLFVSKGRENLSRLLNKEFEGKKVVFYMPTYRYAMRGNRADGNRNWDNYFGFDSFDNNRFDEFITENNIELILKLHPAEEALIINNIDISSNVNIITNGLLEQNNMDLYEVLNSCDLLITDYSSVYFDLLLLDKPMVFTPVDLKEYENNRGFLMEPYSYWAPGPKCISQDQLEKEIIKSLNDSEYYKEEREDILNRIHHYKDGCSAKRTWDFIDSLILSD